MQVSPIFDSAWKTIRRCLSGPVVFAFAAALIVVITYQSVSKPATAQDITYSLSGKAAKSAAPHTPQRKPGFQSQPMLAGYTAFSAANRSGFQPISSNKSDGKLDLAVANDGSNSASQGAPSNSATATTATAAQFSQQGPKLVGTGAVGNAQQGFSVSLSADGNTAIVGGPGDNGGAGAAWVWTRSGGVWNQEGPKLVGSGAVRNASQIYYSVALSADGNTALVGGPGDNGGVGAAWVWTRSGGVWNQQGPKLVGSGAVGNANQGYAGVSLSADGNTALVGGGSDNSGAGAAWVWTRSGGVWTQQGSKLVGSGAVGSAQQGFSVSLSADGNTAIVGGLSDNSGVGAAWVWTRSGGVWTQQAPKLIGWGAVGALVQQGRSVSLSADGNTAIVGGFGDDSSTGAAWVWTRSGGVWTQQGTKLVGSGAVGASQGWSVSLSADGNTAIVGGPGDNGGLGAVWVWSRSGGIWTQQGTKIVGSGTVPITYQGFSVSLSADGNTAIAGGYRDNIFTGAAWVFTASTNGLPLSSRIPAHFGPSGTTLFCDSPPYNNQNFGYYRIGRFPGDGSYFDSTTLGTGLCTGSFNAPGNIINPGVNVLTMYTSSDATAPYGFVEFFCTAPVSSAGDCVIVNPSGVAANAGADQTVRLPATVTLDGSRSTSALSYTWSFIGKPPGSTATLNNANTAAPMFTPDKAGLYSIQLTVSNQTTSATDIVLVSAVDANCTGAALRGYPVSLSARPTQTQEIKGYGGSGSYTWSLVTNASGGSLSSTTGSRVNYTAGSNTGTDVIRLTDVWCGTKDVVIQVSGTGRPEVSESFASPNPTRGAATFAISANFFNPVLQAEVCADIERLSQLPATGSCVPMTLTNQGLRATATIQTNSFTKGFHTFRPRGRNAEGWGHFSYGNNVDIGPMKPAILLLHGYDPFHLGSHPEKWRDFVVSGLRSDFPDATIRVVDNLDSWGEINKNAQALGEYINDRRNGVSDADYFILIGHSMGGLISRAYADSSPDKIRAIITIDSVLAANVHDFGAELCIAPKMMTMTERI